MLNSICEPKDIKKFTISQLADLAGQIQTFLIDTVSKTGGHIGANLGVIELTIAIHYVFNAPQDTILFDVGHQGYTHRILTGRSNLFPTLNSFEGMSRFISRKESQYDGMDASHAGTAISIGTGIAYSYKLKGSDDIVIAVVGDGSLVEGMSWEGLNFSTERDIPLLIIINDNGMSIPKNVGGLSKLLANSGWKEKSKTYFTALGFQYLAVEDGHDLTKLIETMTKAAGLVKKGSTIVHVKTEKGRGLALAKEHPYKMHFSMPFNPETGEGSCPVPAGLSFAKIAGDTLYDLIKKDKDIVVLTPATPYASGIEQCLIDFPDNAIDVGMAEQHAMGMSAGLALQGKKVFVCFQTTFMQRAMDQLFHDICFMDLPITIIAARSGFAGYDSPTHHGIYDLSYLGGLPNLNIFYAGTSIDLKNILQKRAVHAEKPLVILHPYENVWQEEENYFSTHDDDISKSDILFDGKDGFIFAVGNKIMTAVKLRELLKEKNQDFGVLNIRWINPLPKDQLIQILRRVNKIITLEENVQRSGFGASIATLISEQSLENQLFISAIQDEFVRAGDKETLSKITKIDEQSILEKVTKEWAL
jgi:1-deoxy-D-xylulose-5-phosphate synthase